MLMPLPLPAPYWLNWRNKMNKGMFVVLALYVLLLTYAGGVIYFDTKEFEEECRSHGGTPVITRDTSVCYAPGTIIDKRS